MPLTTYTAGQVLTAASLNANLSFAASNGLALISTTTIGSAVSSVTVSSAFSSTYDNYLITANGGVGSATQSMKVTLGSTVTGYYYNVVVSAYNAASPAGGGGSNVAFWFAGYCNPNTIDLSMNVNGPNLAKRTTYSMSAAIAAAAGENGTGRGFLDDATQYTAFTITPNSGTLTGGTIRVYGYQNS
jgi:hypothetical protein